LVRASDVRSRQSVPERIVVVLAIPRCACLVVDAAILLGQRNRFGAQVVVREPSPLVELIERARFEQQTAGRRLRPVERDDPLRMTPPVVTAGLARRRRVHERRTLARGLLTPRYGELVPLVRLPRETHLTVFPCRVVGDTLIRVRIELEYGEILRRGVARHPADVRRRPQVPRGAVEPETISPDRPAESWIDIAIHLDGVRVEKSAVPQIVVQVRRGEPFTRITGKQRPVERIAAITRNDVQSNAAFG